MKLVDMIRNLSIEHEAKRTEFLNKVKEKQEKKRNEKLKEISNMSEEEKEEALRELQIQQHKDLIKKVYVNTGPGRPKLGIKPGNLFQ